MKAKLISIEYLLAAAAALAVSTHSSHAQGVIVNATMTSTPGAGGSFDYVLTLQNTGSESVESLWLGWVPGSFNIANPSSPGNTLGWTDSLSEPNSIQYGGTAGTALAPGNSGVFTFDSTTTPAQFAAHTGQAGDSTAYGVNAANGQLSFTLSGTDTETFFLQVVPEPSTVALLAIGSLGLLGALRRGRARSS